MEQLVRFYSRNVRKEAVDSLLTLFFLLQQQREEIPDVFELWGVCLNQEGENADRDGGWESGCCAAVDGVQTNEW